MDKKEQDFILQHQMKRRKHKVKLAMQTIITILIAIIFIITYFILSRNDYNKYIENANVDYKVNLKENEFYESDSLDDKTSVVASLIKNIDATFKYNLDLENEQDYTYSYKILAKTNVKEGTRENTVYETTEELLNKEIQDGNSKSLEIIESVNLDYDKYNEKINKFIEAYDLDDITSTLEIDMYVYVINKYDEQQINKDSKVMTISIPLTTKTVDVNIDTNVIKDEGQILVKSSIYDNAKYMMIIGIIILIIGFANLIHLIGYILDTRSAETMYDQELKMILFNYKSYIQKINEKINFNNYKIVEINSFNELLSLKDTIQAPILMYTEENTRRTFFTIINDGILYVFILGSQEIREVLRKKAKEKKSK